MEYIEPNGEATMPALGLGTWQLTGVTCRIAINRVLEASLSDLDTDHVDLALVHGPNDDYPLRRTPEALNEQRERGRTRMVGVSNFTPSLVEEAREPAQVVLRRHVQQDGVAAIPRSQEPGHIRSNLEVFDFELTDEEMGTLSSLARGERLIDPAWAPAWGS